MPGKVSPEAAVVGGDGLFFCLEKSRSWLWVVKYFFAIFLDVYMCVKKIFTWIF